MKRSLSQIFKKKTPEFPGLETLLSAVLSKKDIKEVLSFCPDKRELYRAAALALKEDEATVIASIAQRFHFAHISRVQPMDLELMPEGISLEHFKRIGAIGVTRDGVLQGVIAVDPSLVKKLFPAIGRQEIMLSSWQNIHAALQLSEKKYVETLRQKKTESGVQEDLLRQVYEYIFSEMVRYEASRVLIEFESDSLSYSVVTPDQKRAKGSIHHSFHRGMLHTLKRSRELLPVGIAVNEIETDAVYELVRVDSLESSLEESDRAEEQIQESVEVQEVTQDTASVDRTTSDASLSESGTLGCVVQMPLRKKEEAEATDDDGYTGDILIIDDNKVFRDVLQRFLERKGLTVKSIESAEGAYRALVLKKFKPDLVICDMHLPGMNGLSFVNKIREEEEIKDLPVIMLSSDDTFETKLECIGSGADHYLQKSDDPRLLCAHVLRLLHRHKKSEAA